MRERLDDFSLRALYDALDEQRGARGISWAVVTQEVSRHCTVLRPIASSTITGLKNKRVGEGDGILQMLLWLDRSPESFVPGFEGPDGERYRLPQVGPRQILRLDTKKLHAAIDAQRRELGLTWAETARTIAGYTPNMLTNLAKGPRTGFPHVMRLVRWLNRPLADFTRIARW